MPKPAYEFVVIDPEAAPRRLTICGRTGWTLAQLVKAGPRGVTPLERPAPRWSAYIFDLRHRHKLAIETEREEHGGPFPGRHGRYVLRSRVRAVRP